MKLLVLRFVGLLFCAFQANTMSLKGRALTRYDPCGLGVVHFDKVINMVWLGVVNLGLYPDLEKAVIEINFENPVVLSLIFQNSTLIENNDQRNYIFELKEELPQKYIFYLSMTDISVDTPVIKNFKLNNISLCNESIKVSQTVDSLSIKSGKNTLAQQLCGRRSIDHTELTSVRTDSKSGDWPWHVAIFEQNQGNRSNARYMCGGNVISRTAILTAGHCVFLYMKNVRIETNRIFIVAGTSNLINIHQEGKQLLPAVKVIIHPGYSIAHATSDLAIVVVNKLLYTEYVQPICIWGPIYDKTKLYGQEAVVTGFGMTEENKLSNTLRSSYTRVQNDSTCIAYSPRLYLSLLNEFTFCAGEGPNSGTNPRNGDSGGGLVVATTQPDHKISWFLRGILSKCGVPAGQTNCDPKFYVVYTDVGPHYGWIFHNAGLNYKSNIIK